MINSSVITQVVLLGSNRVSLKHVHNLTYSGDWSYTWLNVCMTAAATEMGFERKPSFFTPDLATNYYTTLSLLHKANTRAILTMLYIGMTVFEPGHTAAVLSSLRYTSRMQLCSLLLQRMRFSFLRKLHGNRSSTKKQISSTLRTRTKKNPAIFCYARQVTSSESFANRNNLMWGVTLILVQLSPQRQTTPQHTW